MPKLINRYFRWRFLLALSALVIVMYLFWTSSRYPSLGDKALMGGQLQLEDKLSFDAHFFNDPSNPRWKKIIISTANWLETNRQGMTFGVVLGSVFLTMMRYLQIVSFKNRFANSALGLLMGTPLGVCVNCAAPIAKGMYDGGARIETTLSAMIASPTLNIVVLTMLMSGIVPLYLAGAKIALSIVLILLIIPLLCRFLPSRDLQLPEAEQLSCPIPQNIDAGDIESLGKAIPGFLKNLTVDFWYIFKLTVPLMILAGFLGVLVATFIPFETFSSLKFGIAGLLLAALIGTFLPVPIAFDVVFSVALLAAGLPVGYVMCLLFTLGSFSIYSAFIVTQTISWRPAMMVYATVMTIGILSGLGANIWQKHITAKAIEMTASDPSSNASNDGLTSTPERMAALLNGKSPTPVIDRYDVSIDGRPFEARSPGGETLFTRIEAHNIGLDQPIEFSFKDMWPPFWEGRSISSGDWDRDGDMDIVIASTEVGLYFYENDGDGQFSRLPNPIESTKQLDLFNAVLVDLNDDGWLDLFLTSYANGNFAALNNAGSFSAIEHVGNNPRTPLTLAVSFGDVDQDGDLDVALGNWAAGWYRRVPGEESRNRIVYNVDGSLTGEIYQDLPAVPGETLSILLSDMNNDQKLDLMVGNDFEIPDAFYHGDGTTSFDQILRTDNIIPNTTTTTMAIKHHDLDHDLVPEIYTAQIAGRSSGISDRLNMQPVEDYCQNVERLSDAGICQANMNVKNWYKSGNNFDPTYAGKCNELPDKSKAECQAMLVKDLAIQAKDPNMCNNIAVDQIQARYYCQIHFWPIRPYTDQDIAVSIPQIKGRNVLLKKTSGPQYHDTAIEAQLDVGGWSWDTKIADFDNDSHPDILIVNGTWVPNSVTPSNMFFHNQGDGTFEQSAEEFGLEDFLITAAASQVDIDRDGDLDIVTVPVNGPLQFFKNNNQTGNAISISFDDKIGNRFGIGHKVRIFYGEGGQQIQEMQLGGGFQSFDAAYLHFGLGAIDQIDRIVIDWIEGGGREIKGPFAAGHHYVISRFE
ncbi:MAG: RNA-binding protein [Hellea sp.]|nr:RNA-binding protein [Hellea sp.]